MMINKLYVVRINNLVCGVMLLKDRDNEFWDDEKPAYYIHHLTTDINKKGIGKILIKYAIEQGINDNKKYLRLDCFKESLFLNEYYKSFGFVNVGEGKIGNYEYNLLEKN